MNVSPGPGETGRGRSSGLPLMVKAGPASAVACITSYSPGPGASCPPPGGAGGARPAIVNAGPRPGAGSRYCPGPAERSGGKERGATRRGGWVEGGGGAQA